MGLSGGPQEASHGPARGQAVGTPQVERPFLEADASSTAVQGLACVCECLCVWVVVGVKMFPIS